MSPPELCPLHGGHPEMSCPFCDEAAARRRADRLRLGTAPDGPGSLENLVFMVKRFATTKPELAGTLIGATWFFAGLGVLKMLKWLFPATVDPLNDFGFEVIVFVAPAIALLVIIRARFES